MPCHQAGVRMKRVLSLLVLASLSHALNAPYLISATALSDSSVELSWRNNDAATEGYIIQRKDSTEAVYRFIDSVKSASQLTYTDMNGLLPLTLYTYHVIAYNTVELSDTSNSVQVITNALTEIFVVPSVSFSEWHGDTSSSVRITITDASNCETGFRVYREQDFSSFFSVIADTISTVPKRMGDQIIVIDDHVSFNTWHRYRIAVYKSNDSLFSPACTTYTFHYSPPQRQGIVRFHKLGDFPISTDSTGWSARSGDSIILKENPSPAGMFSVINVSNTASPSFGGYIDSAAARAYPLQTLIPVFLTCGVSNSYTNTKVKYLGDKMFIAIDSTVWLYQVVGSNLVGVDSITIHEGNAAKPNLLLLNDTLLAIRHIITRGVPSTGESYYLYITSTAGSRFSPPLFTYEQIVFRYSPGMALFGTYFWRPYIHGVVNNELLISCDYMYDYSNSGYHTYTYSNSCVVYSLSNNAKRSIPFNMPHVNTFHTGHLLSLNENLCTNGFPLFPMDGERRVSYPYIPSAIPTELFVVSDVRDPRPRATDSTNNAIYLDTVHLQNQLRNILLDTAKQRVYLVFNNNLSILGYDRTVGVVPCANTLSSLKKLVVLSNTRSGVTIVRPNASRAADFYFYDLSGRVIDRMLDVTSNAVFWRPKTRSMNCYIVMVKSGSEKYSAKFMVR